MLTKNVKLTSETGYDMHMEMYTPTQKYNISIQGNPQNTSLTHHAKMVFISGKVNKTVHSK